MKKVFVSYVRENKGVVERLANALTAADLEVWFDLKDLAPGMRWKDEIRQAIEAGGFFLACFSPEYHARERTHMEDEIIQAIEESRLRKYDKPWIIPVLLEPCEIPARPIGGGETLRDLQAVMLYEGWKVGIQGLLQVMGANPIPAPFESRPHAFGHEAERGEASLTDSTPSRTSGGNALARTDTQDQNVGTDKKPPSPLNFAPNKIASKQSNAFDSRESLRRRRRRLILSVTSLAALFVLIVTAVVLIWQFLPRQIQKPNKPRFSGQEVAIQTPKLPTKPATIEPVPEKQEINKHDADLERVISQQYGASDHDIKYWLAKGAHFTPQCLIEATFKATDQYTYDERIKLVKKIIDAGISVNSRGNYPAGNGCGDSPLAVAVCRLSTRTVSFLLKNGADPKLLSYNHYDKRGQSLISIALSNGEGDPVVFEIVDLLIAKGADINRQDENGRTVLMDAAEWNQRSIVEFLLKKGAKKGLVDNTGHNAQYYAEKQDTELATLLAP